MAASDDIEARLLAAAADLNARIDSCHEEVACPRCCQPVGYRCVRVGQLAGPPLKHPHKQRWTLVVPAR